MVWCWNVPFAPVRWFKISWRLAKRQIRQREGLPVPGGGKHQTAGGFLSEEGMDTSAFISMGAVLCFGEHWVSQAGVKEGVQTAQLVMFTQPQCFPQEEDVPGTAAGQRGANYSCCTHLEPWQWCFNLLKWTSSYGKNLPVKWLIPLVIRSPFN